MSSEWYLDILIFTYFDVFTNFVDQKVFKQTIYFTMRRTCKIHVDDTHVHVCTYIYIYMYKFHD
jgi:hypothetical protein